MRIGLTEGRFGRTMASGQLLPDSDIPSLAIQEVLSWLAGLL